MACQSPGVPPSFGNDHRVSPPWQLCPSTITLNHSFGGSAGAGVVVGVVARGFAFFVGGGFLAVAFVGFVLVVMGWVLVGCAVAWWLGVAGQFLNGRSISTGLSLVAG